MTTIVSAQTSGTSDFIGRLKTGVYAGGCKKPPQARNVLLFVFFSFIFSDIK